MKTSAEILAEAELAHKAGAFRYCIVSAGRGPSDRRVERLAGVVREIKATYPLEVCVSAGILDDGQAKTLADAGLDRLNHNLNTSEDFYPEICTTHTYADRVDTLLAAKRHGISTCSGVIAGMGESPQALVEVAKALRGLGSDSIPVNFLLPFDGNQLDNSVGLTPAYCLRVLCMFRLANPKAEIRISAGREFHLRSLQPLALYPANSLFIDGYLNAKGSEADYTYQMVRDAGFEITSHVAFDDLAPSGEPSILANDPNERPVGAESTVSIKTRKDLRPVGPDGAEN